MTTLVDSNIVIYLLNPEEPFHERAMAAASKCRLAGPLVISDIVYSEISVAFDSIAAVNVAVNSLALDRAPLSDAALFRAAIAFREYRKRGGPKTNVLSDFLIGAQAETSGIPLLTNNRKDYTFYFPRVILIEPT